MSKPIPANPYDSHSYQTPKDTTLCAKPYCRLPVAADSMLCELHR